MKVSKARKARDAATRAVYRRLAPRLSKRRGHEDYTEDDVEGFRRAQRLANECVVSVAERLVPGVTEREAADQLYEFLRERGATHYLHRPFAWFGEHSRFDPYEEDYDLYHPTDRSLREDDVFILDVSPILEGYTGDVGYASSLVPHQELEGARAFLRELREAIPGLFASDLDTHEIWAEVGSRIERAGYDACHCGYPFRVLGHRVYRVPDRQLQHGTPKRFRSGPMGQSWFSHQAMRAFGARGLVSELITPEHRGTKLGLWAIEPHIGGPSFGAKFEEILQVDESNARWIDDDVPLMHASPSPSHSHTQA